MRINDKGERPQFQALFEATCLPHTRRYHLHMLHQANNALNIEPWNSLMGPSTSASQITASRRAPDAVHTVHTPVFDIESGNCGVGYVSRGHALLIPEARRQGIFGSALAHLEAYERTLFIEGGFPRYQRAILEGLGTPSGDAETVIRRLSTPHHIDFWRKPEIASKYLRYGYTLDGFTRHELERRRYIDHATSTTELAAVLVRHADALRGHVICILTKPASNER